jgi:hypothetical protein
MTFDHGPAALAVAVALTAVVFGPLVPVVEMPGTGRGEQPVFDGFGGHALGVDHRLSFETESMPTVATFTDGAVTTAPPTVVVATGDTSVTLRYQLRVDGRSTDATAVVPAGEARSVTRTLELSVKQRPDRVRLRVTVETNGEEYLVEERSLRVTDDEG